MTINYVFKGKIEENMAETKQMLFAKNLVCVCVDQVQDEDFSGKIYHQYADDPVYFASATDFLIKMERLMDDWDFPQRGLAERTFRKESGSHVKSAGPMSSDDGRLPIEIVQEVHGVRNVQNKKGDIGTFVVQVVFRQAATWQGHVIFQEKNEKHDFRSALQLLKYMDACVNKKD